LRQNAEEDLVEASVIGKFAVEWIRDNKPFDNSDRPFDEKAANLDTAGFSAREAKNLLAIWLTTTSKSRVTMKRTRVASDECGCGNGTHEDQELLWIRCKRCQTWWALKCLNMPDSALGTLSARDFFCHQCDNRSAPN